MIDIAKDAVNDSPTVGDLLHWISEYKKSGQVTNESSLRICVFFGKEDGHYPLPAGAIGCHAEQTGGPQGGVFNIFVDVAPIATIKPS